MRKLVDFKELRFIKLKNAKKAQDEIKKDYGYRPEIFKADRDFIIIKPIDLIKIR